MHEFYLVSSPQQQGIGNVINLKTDDGWETIFYQVKLLLFK